jgi:TonB-linked SusC/RagA family outer membrane protein
MLNAFYAPPFFKRRLTLKTLMIMNFTVIFLLACALQVSANTYSQNVTLHLENAPLNKVFQEIKKQTGYTFMYTGTMLKQAKKVTIQMKNSPLRDALKLCFSDQPFSYTIIDETVVLQPKEKAAEERGNSTIALPPPPVEIHGRVVNQQGEPLSGVSVLVSGTRNGTTTDNDGRFTLSVEDNKNIVLEVSSVGYQDKEVNVGNQTQVNIVLEISATGLSDVVVVGYGTQKKVNLTGAVSAIKGSDIVTTKNENVQNMLTGKIPGVRVTQKTAEPGSFNNNFDIRAMGSPLIVIDGIPATTSDFQRLDANDIDNISVLKDATAAIYGVRAANGVVLVTTKKGSKNKLELNYSGSFTWQIPSGLPKTVDAIQYMTLRNEQAMHNVNGGSPIFTDEQFDDYRNGVKQSTDWYPLVFSNYAPQTMHNLSATGGNDKTTYYVGLGYEYQQGFFKSGNLNYSKYNVRSNISTKISDRLTFDLNLNLMQDEQDRPYVDSWWIIRSYWRQGPQIPAYANNDPTKPFQGLIEGDNPISFMNKSMSGYKNYNNKWIQSSASLQYDLPGVKGLYLKGLFSYNYNISGANLFQKEYNQYTYDEASDSYTKYTRQSPNRIRRENYSKTQTLSQLSLNYSGTFNNHHVGGLLLGEAQKRTGDNFFAQRDLVLQLPYLFAGTASGQLASMNANADALYQNSNLALVGRANYDFNNKYLAEFLFRYDGSSKFAEGSQWGFFPAASVGWRVSKEKFFENIEALSFINQFKIRASYGKTGDDNASSYQFISGYNYPTSSDPRNFTGGYVFDGNFNASADNKGIPNPNITWFTSKTFDIGVDLEAWNGLFGLTIDYFSRHRDGLLATRTGGIPTVVGAGLPQENLNSDRTYGFDMEVTHRNHIGNFNYNVKGIFSLARVERLYVEHGAIGSSWSNWLNNQTNRLQGVHRGLQGAGQYQSWEEIWNSPTYIGRGTVPGDYKYEDWNGDGEINGNDAHPIRFDQYPWVNFSLIFDASWKGFDINFLMQGSAMSSLIYGEQLREPLWGNGNSGAMEQFMDRWHPVDPKADPYDPATKWVPGHFAYTGTLPDVNSTFNDANGAYLRLKSIELGYTLPYSIIKKTGLKNFRVYANAYNLLTFTQVKFVDPEHPLDTYGYLYPLNKTVSVGVNIKF